MEIALNPAMPTYSGGLGILAGDTLRSSADLGVHMVAVSLLHRKGYFRQRLDAAGRQREETADWNVDAFFEPVAARVAVTINGRRVLVGARRRVIGGARRRCRARLLSRHQRRRQCRRIVR
jgi:starch phosphorylase